MIAALLAWFITHRSHALWSEAVAIANAVAQGDLTRRTRAFE